MGTYTLWTRTPAQVAATARASWWGKPGAPGKPRYDVLEADPREDRDPVPLGLPVGGGLIAAAGQLLAQQLGEGLVGELGLLQADHVGAAFLQPRQQPPDTLLDRVDVPGRHPHGATVAAGGPFELLPGRGRARGWRILRKIKPR